MPSLYALRNSCQYELRIFFHGVSSAMTWQQCLDLGPTALSRLLGCPVTTAHSWIRRSGPADWQKVVYAEFISRKLEAEQSADTNG